MSEKTPGATESWIGKKTKEWRGMMSTEMKIQTGAGIMGATGGTLMTYAANLFMGVTNPFYLAGLAAVAAVGGYKFFKSEQAEQKK
jgi:hypothetical protein